MPGKFSLADAIRAEIQRALAGQSFSSEEAMRDFVNEKMAGVDRAPVADFQGLSREQVHRLIHAPFDPPELVRFAEGIEGRPAATAIRILEVIVDAAGEEGIKLTAKGDLPRAVVYEATSRRWRRRASIPEALPVHPYPRATHEQRALAIQAIDKK